MRGNKVVACVQQTSVACVVVSRVAVWPAVSDNVATRIVLCLTVPSTHNPEIWTTYTSLANPKSRVS